MLFRIRRRILIEFRRIREWHARWALKRHSQLWCVLQDYLKQSQSTGCNVTDYYVLYTLVRRDKKAEILECGTGVSTLIMAYALMENEGETGVVGRITSMDESREWLEMSQRLLPEAYKKYVDFVYSPVVEDQFSIFRGVRYQDIPERSYDFVFIDGPKYESPVDGSPTFDFDFLHVLRTADKPVSGLIDKRVSTCFVFQQIFGRKKMRYSPVLHLGFISPCTKADLGNLERELSSVNFENSFVVWQATKLIFTKS